LTLSFDTSLRSVRAGRSRLRLRRDPSKRRRSSCGEQSRKFFFLKGKIEEEMVSAKIIGKIFCFVLLLTQNAPSFSTLCRASRGGEFFGFRTVD